jgi:hypothetical protein
MFTHARTGRALAGLMVVLLAAPIACSSDDDSGGGGSGGRGGTGGSTGGRGGSGGSTGGSGGSSSTGGSGGSTGGSGGSTGGSGGSTGGSGGSTGGTGGTGGTAGSGGSGGTGGSADGGKSDGGKADGGAADKADSPPASAAGQGPVAQGKIAFSQDFEMNMDGMERSPNGLPAERIQIVDDPKGERGKVVRIQYLQGDNFRTSGGTEPRSWFSSAKGYTVRPGTHVSVAWGFMWENANMGAHFAQIIRDGGPLWMFGVDQGGTAKGAVHRGSGGTSSFKIEPMKWYNFRVDTDYKGGGEIKFYVNDMLIGTGRGDGGAPARFDCGIYWMHNGKSTRTVYVSNVSIGEIGQ